MTTLPPALEILAQSNVTLRQGSFPPSKEALLHVVQPDANAIIYHIDPVNDGTIGLDIATDKRRKYMATDINISYLDDRAVEIRLRKPRLFGPPALTSGIFNIYRNLGTYRLNFRQAWPQAIEHTLPFQEYVDRMNEIRGENKK